MRARLVLAAAVAALSACGERDAAVACTFGEGHLHAHAEGAIFHDVELVTQGEGAALLYSDRSGLHALELDATGRARGESRRLGTACPGGIAAFADGDALMIACSRPADLDRGRQGAITLIRAAGDRAEVIGSAAPVGPESRGVAIAREGDHARIGWRSASALTSRAYVAELAGGRVGESRALSSEETLASAPSVIFLEGRPLFAWTESWLDGEGRARGHLLTQREGEPPMPSLEVADIDVRVRLASDPRGPMIALRDRRPAGADAHRAFAGRLDERLRLSTQGLRSPSRADDPDAEPMLVPCGDHVFSVTARRSSRGVTMVTLRRLDADLRSVEAEHQIYEYHARFPLAAGVCAEGALLVAVGERPTEVTPTARLRTYSLRCGPGVEHARTPGIEGQVLRQRGAGRI